MAGWQLSLDSAALHSAGVGRGPLFVRLASLISVEIRRGRLRPGARLPGTRSLASVLGLNRNTVVAAYAELVAEGWVFTRPAGGSFVSDRLPEIRRASLQRELPAPALSRAAGFELRAVAPALDPPEPRVGCALWAGPDLRELPELELARAYRRALGWQRHANLDYQGSAGHPRLRAALSEMVAASRGVSACADNVLVTRGSQMALDLLVRLLIRPGDRVAVEEVGYQPAWGVLRLAGAELVFIPVDRDGMDIDVLLAQAQVAPIRAVYVTPHHQYPTTVSLSVGRRLRLLGFAAEQRVVILEDDYDHEFHYEGRPLLPLASADPRGVVAYVGTLSKILAPGLRLGFIVANAPLIEQLTRLRFLVDRQGDQVVEYAVSELIEDGELQRHARRMRRLYQSRRDVFAAALRRELGSALSFDSPRGGMAIWARAERGIDVPDWSARCARAGVSFSGGQTYAAPGLEASKRREYAQALRLGFARYDAEELEAAVAVLAREL
jgi:GntR family transcriptional regulator / MocR family aminotransferase